VIYAAPDVAASAPALSDRARVDPDLHLDASVTFA
jgi:hypothetical protein